MKLQKPGRAAVHRLALLLASSWVAASINPALSQTAAEAPAERGTLSVLFENDYFFHEFSEKRAYPLGINVIFYLMTH